MSGCTITMDQLAYISTIAPGVGEDDIRHIIEQSRRNNPQQRITGHLQCCCGHFFQILEGPAAALDDLLSRLRRDPRHEDMRLLFRQRLNGREFANWSMGFGPCSKAALSADLTRRFHALLTAGQASPQRVLAVFYALMSRSMEAPDETP